MAYPVTFDIEPPERFQKPHVFIRILVIIVLSFVGFVGWLLGAVYLIFPIAAAVMISQKGVQRFLAESEGNLTTWSRYVVAVYAYMGFLTDRLPNEDPKQIFQLNVQPGGEPTAGAALMRIIFGIPSAIVLGLLGLAFIVVLPVSAISILINEQVPSWCYGFTRGYLRWQARLLAYMGSLVDEYPPFSFEGGASMPAPAPSAPSGEGTPPASGGQ